jgi:hypothetical protein
MNLGRSLFVTAACLILLAGCTGPTEPVATTTAPVSTTMSAALTGKAANESFDGAALPNNWIAHKGTWTMKAGGTGHAKVLEGKGDADPGLSSLVDHADGTFGDFTMEVDFLMVSGEHPQGAGVVFDWKDDKNYQIIRYSISENGWHLFTVVNGNRDKQGGATIANTTSPQFNQWVHLKVVQEGGEVTVFDGSTRVIEYFLKEGNSRTGYAGVFCRGDTLAQFDNYSIKPSAT